MSMPEMPRNPQDPRSTGQRLPQRQGPPQPAEYVMNPPTPPTGSADLSQRPGLVAQPREQQVVMPRVEEYMGPGTTHAAIPDDTSGVEIVVGRDQAAAALEAIVLTGIQKGGIIDVVDLASIAGGLANRAKSQSLDMRVVDASDVLDVLPTQNALHIATQVIPFDSEPARDYADMLLERIQSSLQETADRRGDENPRFRDVVSGLEYLRNGKPGTLSMHYQRVLDEARIVSPDDLRTKADQLANLHGQLESLSTKSNSASPEVGRVADRVSTVWRRGPNPDSTREIDISTQILSHAIPSLLSNRGVDGIVIPGMHSLTPDVIDKLSDVAQERDIRLVAFYDPARTSTEVLDRIGTDPSRTLIVMKMRPEAAARFESKFPPEDTLQTDTVSRTGTKGGGSSHEMGVSKSSTGGDNFSGGQGRSDNSSYAVVVGQRRVLLSSVRAAEIGALQPGQAIVLGPDGKVYRTTLLQGQDPSVGGEPALLGEEDQQFLDDARTRSIAGGHGAVAQIEGRPNETPRQRAGAAYKVIKDGVVRPDEVPQPHAVHKYLERRKREKDLNHLSVPEFLMTTDQGTAYWLGEIGVNWRKSPEGREWLESEYRRLRRKDGIPSGLEKAAIEVKVRYMRYYFDARNQGERPMTPREFYQGYQSEFPSYEGIDYSQLYRPANWPDWTRREQSGLRKLYAQHLATAEANGNNPVSPEEFCRHFGMHDVYLLDSRYWQDLQLGSGTQQVEQESTRRSGREVVQATVERVQEGIARAREVVGDIDFDNVGRALVTGAEVLFGNTAPKPRDGAVDGGQVQDGATQQRTITWGERLRAHQLAELKREIARLETSGNNDPDTIMKLTELRTKVQMFSDEA